MVCQGLLLRVPDSYWACYLMQTSPESILCPTHQSLGHPVPSHFWMWSVLKGDNGCIPRLSKVFNLPELVVLGFRKPPFGHTDANLFDSTKGTNLGQANCWLPCLVLDFEAIIPEETIGVPMNNSWWVVDLMAVVKPSNRNIKFLLDFF